VLRTFRVTVADRIGRSIAAGSRFLTVAGTARVALRPTAKARRALRRMRSATVTLKVRSTDGETTRTTTQRLRLGR